MRAIQWAATQRVIDTCYSTAEFQKHFARRKKVDRKES